MLNRKMVNTNMEIIETKAGIDANEDDVEIRSSGINFTRILNRRSTSINNFIPPSMETNLPSLNRYYSLNRNRNINNLDIVNHNNRNNFYCTMSHRPSNVRLILPQSHQDQCCHEYIFLNNLKMTPT